MRFYSSLALLVLGTVAAQGAVIPLFNTGTDASNVALPGGDGVADLHYIIVETSGTPVTYFNGAYAPEDADSRWISENSNGNTSLSILTFRLIFDLTGFNASTATITGSWGTDNCGAITLNSGPATGLITDCGSIGSFNTLTSFSISSGFVAGINTLDFVLQNADGPGAVRVDNLVGSADLSAVSEAPEPSSMLLIGTALAALGAAKRFRR